MKVSWSCNGLNLPFGESFQEGGKKKKRNFSVWIKNFSNYTYGSTLTIQNSSHFPSALD